MKLAVLDSHTEFFDENGYVIFEDLLDPQLIESMPLDQLAARRQLGRIMAELAGVFSVSVVESQVVRKPREVPGSVGILYLTLEPSRLRNLDEAEAGEVILPAS